MAITTLDPESGDPYNFESLPPAVKSLITKWKEYLCKFPAQKETLSKNISALFQQEFNICLLNSDKETIFDLSEKLKLINQDKYDLEYKLSVFSILATTWPYWDALRTSNYLGKQKDSVKKCLASIVDLIFPSSTKNPLQTDAKQSTPEQLPAEKNCENVKEYKQSPETFKGHVGDISTVIRVAVTGRRNTPDLYEIMKLLGGEEVVSRLKAAAEKLS